MIFLLCLIYFTQHDTLQVHPCCCKWHYFIFMANIPLYTCTTSSLSIPLLMDILAVSTAWLLKTVLQRTLGCIYLLGSCFSLDICLGVGLQGHWIIWQSIFIFLRNLHTILQWLYEFTFQPKVQEDFLLSTPSPAFVVCGFFDDGLSAWCEVVPHYSFDLHLSNKQ